jgi:heat shock protein
LGANVTYVAAGWAFDEVLRDHFRTEFKKKYGLDAATKPRAWQRLLEKCEKLKVQMSSNSAPIYFNIHCFMEDKDLQGKIRRSVT